jgi:hypothetical protein
MLLSWIIGGVLLPILITVVMWIYIIELFSKVIIPMIRKGLGNQVADAVATIVSWLDNPVSIVRGAVLDAWRQFKSGVLGIKTTWKTKRGRAIETTEVIYLLDNGETGNRTTTSEGTPSRLATARLDNGEAEIQTTIRGVPREKLPPEIRAKMVRLGTDVAELDMMEALERRVKETAKKQEIILENVC